MNGTARPHATVIQSSDPTVSLPFAERAPKPKFTGKVRRGLALVRSLLIDALDDDKPPATTIVQGWKASAQHDFNAAMAWIESNELVPATSGGL